MTQHSADADNDNIERPKSFDDAVLKHMSFFRKMAHQYRGQGDREEFIQEVLLYIFQHWRNYRLDDYSKGSGFFNWLHWQVRAVVSKHRIKAKNPLDFKTADDKILETHEQMATQDRAVEAMDILKRISDNRDGTILLRHAMGEDLATIGKSMNICCERVRQLEKRELKRLNRSIKRRVAA